MPSADPVSSGTAAVDAPPTSTTPPPSGRPPLVLEKTDKITDTFGATPAAKLVLKNEGGWFRIPEHALSDGLLITFMLDKKAPKKAKGGVGSIYRLNAQLPPAEESHPTTSRVNRRSAWDLRQRSQRHRRIPTRYFQPLHDLIGAHGRAHDVQQRMHLGHRP